MTKEIIITRDSEIVNARIRSTKLELCDRGPLTATIFLDLNDNEYVCSSIGFGGLRLDRHDEKSEKLDDGKGSWIPSASCAAFIRGVLEAVGVNSWEDLEGTLVRIIMEGMGAGTKVLAIGHILENRAFWIDKAFQEKPFAEGTCSSRGDAFEITLASLSGNSFTFNNTDDARTALQLHLLQRRDYIGFTFSEYMDDLKPEGEILMHEIKEGARNDTVIGKWKRASLSSPSELLPERKTFEGLE